MDVEVQTFQRGDQVAYLPPHTEGDVKHRDVQLGFVTSIKGDYVYCRFWFRDTPGHLRTVANSERCFAEQLVKHESVFQLMVDALLLNIP